MTKNTYNLLNVDFIPFPSFSDFIKRYIVHIKNIIPIRASRFII